MDDSGVGDDFGANGRFAERLLREEPERLERDAWVFRFKELVGESPELAGISDD